ncbi:uncharacterized protein LOC134250982 [Saccostrea cucullata]|uniref:uncharacterized protein LOC134250982 n=1 Tax=Saccostrea cuccullata TaxID=36930 RepID=UPI002ED2B318
MEDFSTQCMIKTCSNCDGDTEFYCNTCKSNLCPQCKERHVIDLDTAYHDVVIYREKSGSIQKAEICRRHPKMIYEMYCHLCELPVSNLCIEHKSHEKLDLEDAYKKPDSNTKKIFTKSERSVKVKDISYGRHLSIVTPDKFWVSDWNNLILTDNSGETLQKVTDKAAFGGVHTVSSAGELIYIDIKGDVKIQTDSHSMVMLMRITDSLRPTCLHYCVSSGELLIGMRIFNYDT